LERRKNTLNCLRDHLHSFPVVQGVPVFTEIGSSVEIRPLDHLSHQPTAEILATFADSPGPWLHLGAGASTERYANSIELETAIFRNTDVIGDAEHLPFEDRSLGGVLALNVFEHLANPEESARELHRVLMPGSRILIQTAFLQPLHADPYHFYNATEQGVSRWFQDFDVDDISIPHNFHPVYALSWMANELLWGIDEAAAKQLGDLTLRDLAVFWQDPQRREGREWDAFLGLPDSRQRVLAAGFQVRATRP
jgi:SAM-dependent methyltransferase